MNSSGWSTRSVYWSTSASIKQLHHSWPRCAFPSQQPTTDVTSALQHTATCQIVKTRNKFLCVFWSAAVVLTTTECPWCIIDTDSVLHMTEGLFCFPEHHHSVKFTYLLTYLQIGRVKWRNVTASSQTHDLKITILSCKHTNRIGTISAG